MGYMTSRVQISLSEIFLHQSIFVTQNRYKLQFLDFCDARIDINCIFWGYKYILICQTFCNHLILKQSADFLEINPGMLAALICLFSQCLEFLNHFTTVRPQNRYKIAIFGF
jgi:hypothetical protein